MFKKFIIHCYLVISIIISSFFTTYALNNKYDQNLYFLIDCLYAKNNVSIINKEGMNITSKFYKETISLYNKHNYDAIINTLSQQELIIEGTKLEYSKFRANGLGQTKTWQSYQFVKVTSIDNTDYRVVVTLKTTYDVVDGKITSVYNNSIFLNSALTNNTSKVSFELINAGYTGCSGLNTPNVKLNYKYGIVAKIDPSISQRPDWDMPDRQLICSETTSTYLSAY